MTEETKDLIVDADGVPLNDFYHVDGVMRTDLPDGVYIGLSDELYFAQDRLGSSDLSKLAGDDPESFWYGSKFNPDREQSDLEEDLLVGKGIHCLCLEGEAAYDSRFIVSPYKAYTGKAAKDWKDEQVAKGLTPIKEKTHKSILLSSNLLIHHPQTGPYIRGGVSEIAVLFSVGGHKLRVKFDKLLMDAIVDVKSSGRHKASQASPEYLQSRNISRDVHTCLRIIRDLKYALQRYLYGLGRVFLRDLVKQGNVYGASPAQHEWLKKVAEVEDWKFVFLFIRKVSHNTKSPSAPVITPIVSQMADFLDEKGFKMFTAAMDNYERLMEKFGPDVSWGRLNEAVIIDDAVMLEMFGSNDDPTKGEEPETDQEFDNEEEDENV